MSFKSLVSVVLLLSPFASFQTASAGEVLQTMQTKLYDLMDKDITTVNFGKGRSQLSEAEVRNIRAVYQSVLDDTSVSGVIVAAWSDQTEIKDGKKLLPAQLAVAQKRTDAVKRILTDLGSKNVLTYVMGQDASWIDKTFRTDDAKVKEVIQNPSKANDSNNLSIAKTLEDKGGPGKAVVIVQRNSTHATTGR